MPTLEQIRLQLEHSLADLRMMEIAQRPAGKWAEVRKAFKEGGAIQYDHGLGWQDWEPITEPVFPNSWEWRIKPLPALPTERVALEASDVPGGSAIRPLIHEIGWYGITEVTHEGIYYSVRGGSRFITFADLMKQSRILRPGSTDWQPCSKESRAE